MLFVASAHPRQLEPPPRVGIEQAGNRRCTRPRSHIDSTKQKPPKLFQLFPDGPLRTQRSRERGLVHRLLPACSIPTPRGGSNCLGWAEATNNINEINNLKVYASMSVQPVLCSFGPPKA